MGLTVRLRDCEATPVYSKGLKILLPIPTSPTKRRNELQDMHAKPQMRGAQAA